MRIAVYKILLFLPTLQWLSNVQSQCPVEYFRYSRNETTNKVIGIVEIPRPPKHAPLYHLRIELNVEANLLNVRILQSLNDFLNQCNQN